MNTNLSTKGPAREGAAEPGRAAFYGRVSTDQQDASLETQDAKAGQYALLRNLAIPPELRFTDPDTSGSIEFGEREGGRRLINTLKICPDVKAVIISKLDRLGRDAFDLERMFRYFKSIGITVHIVDFGGDSFTTSGFLGDLVIRILSAVAEFERMMIRSRIQDQMNAKRAKGEQCGTVPYGKDTVPTGALNKRGKRVCRLVDNPVEQKWIRQMATWRDAGWSYPRIADALNSRGVKTKVPAGTRICTGKDPATKEKIYTESTGQWQAGNVAGVLQSSYSLELLGNDETLEETIVELSRNP